MWVCAIVVTNIYTNLRTYNCAIGYHLSCAFLQWHCCSNVAFYTCTIHQSHSYPIVVIRKCRFAQLLTQAACLW